MTNSTRIFIAMTWLLAALVPLYLGDAEGVFFAIAMSIIWLASQSNKN